MSIRRVLIIGGGPAGMMTAIQLKRFGLEPVLFEASQLGGLLWNANLVENYPGFPGGIPGPKLVARFVHQFEDLGLAPIREQVERLDFDGQDFVAETASGNYPAEVLVVASGTSPHSFSPDLIPDEASDKIFYEVVPLIQHINKTIAIIGAGDAAFDYALNLGRQNKIILLNRSEQIKALPLLVSRVKDHQNIVYKASSPLKQIEAAGDGLHLLVGQEKISADYLIGAIGRYENMPPKTEHFMAHESEMVVRKRLHYIGDVQNGIFRQTAIAVGDGLKTAMQIYQYFQGE